MGSPMNIHQMIYLCLAIAYFEAAVETFTERHHVGACREAVIACLYLSIAGLMVFDPAFVPGMMNVQA
jgi:hypothetical protein